MSRYSEITPISGRRKTLKEISSNNQTRTLEQNALHRRLHRLPPLGEENRDSGHQTNVEPSNRNIVYDDGMQVVESQLGRNTEIGISGRKRKYLGEIDPNIGEIDPNIGSDKKRTRQGP